MIQILYFKESENAERFKSPATLLFPALILGILIIVIGIYPEILSNILDKSAKALFDKLAYIKTVFGGY